MRLAALLLLALLLPAAPPDGSWSDGSWSDAFADGDFTAGPAWTGTAEGWRVAPFRAGRALRTAGAAEADTLVLATASSVAHGRWALTVAWKDVNLSNFSGARLYLVADTLALGGAVRGYALQLGASNADELRLYRQDGAARTLIARSPPLLAAPSDTLRLVAVRSRAGAWAVAVDGDTVLTATDATYAASRAFGLWVKHTAASAEAFAFTDLAVDAAPAPPDTTAPVLVAAAPAGPRRVAATFSEPVVGCAPSAYHLDGGMGTPAAVEGCAGDPATRTLVFAAPLPNHASYTLTARAVADAAGNARASSQASFFVGTLRAPAPGDVVVNEIHYAPPHGTPEYVELLNRSADWLDLGALALSDATAAPAALAPPGTPLAPRALVVVTADPASLAAAFPEAPPARALTDWPALNNGGDVVVLTAGGGAVERVAYQGGDGAALERLDPDGPPDAFNWAPSTDLAGGTPGTRNSRYAPDRAAPTLVFAEELADAVVEVVFSEPLDSASVHPGAFALGGRAPASITDAGDGRAWRLTFAAAPEGAVLTAAGVRDRTGNVLGEGATPYVRRPRPGDVVVNELLADPLADPHDGRPDQPAYVELASRAPYPVSLRGAFWTGAVDERGAADTLRLPAERRALAPGGFAVVFAAGGKVQDNANGEAGALAAAFPGARLDVPGVLLLPLARAGLGLRVDDDVLHLHRRDGTPLDHVAYRRAWHRPDLLDPEGTALERLAPDAPSADAASWASAVHPDGGTPGAPNSLRLPDPAAAPPGLSVAPSPFSPDADGHDDHAVLTYRLGTAAALLRVRVFDAHGRLVRTLTPAALATAEGRLPWDGFDGGGHALPVGIYVVHLEAVDARGGTVEAYAAPVVLARRR